MYARQRCFQHNLHCSDPPFENHYAEHEIFYMRVLGQLGRGALSLDPTPLSKSAKKHWMGACESECVWL